MTEDRAQRADPPGNAVEHIDEPPDHVEPPPLPSTGPATVRRTRTPLVLGLSTLVVVAVATAALAVAAANQRIAGTARAIYYPPPANLALIDSTATGDALHAINAAMTRLLSYDYRHVDDYQAAASELLTGAAAEQLNSLLAVVRAQAPSRRLTLVSSVSDAALTDLTDRQATALVFLNQTYTDGVTGQTSKASAAALVTAVKSAGRWKISDIDTQLVTHQQPLSDAATRPSRNGDITEQQQATQRDLLINRAQHAAEVLCTLRYATAAADFDAWLNVATYELNTNLTSDQATVISQAEAAKIDAVGAASAVAVADLDLDAGGATVLVAMKVTVTQADGTVTVKTTRLLLTMQRTTTTWLARNIALAPAS